MIGNPEYAIIGMNRQTGQGIDDAHEKNGKLAHIRQSLWDIFTTPIGSRIQRREYGSHLFDLIDSPMNAAGKLRLAAALVDAAAKNEPRVTLTAALIDIDLNGRVMLNYTARTLDQEELNEQVYLRNSKNHIN